jgi:hypothetical protein
MAIIAAYGLCRVFDGTKFPQFAALNAIAQIFINVILYGPCPVLKKSA